MVTSSNDLTAAQVRAMLDYNSETGLFTWINSKGRSKAGKTAGSISKAPYSAGGGYLFIGINRRMYSGHRLAWLIVYGEWPEKDIDHKNGIRSDNRISNLRLATSSQNRMNTGDWGHNTSGLRGVRFKPSKSRWMAFIGANKKHIHLGYFETKEEALDARKKAEKEYFGEYVRGQS